MTRRQIVRRQISMGVKLPGGRYPWEAKIHGRQISKEAKICRRQRSGRQKSAGGSFLGGRNLQEADFGRLGSWEANVREASII